MSFIVATGIECSAPTIGAGVRRDELLLTGHWGRVEEDLDLVVAMGITHLRYGVPFHIVARDPDRLDWTWTDASMAALRERAIEPIVDLMHFGVPDDLWGVSDPRLISRYRTYVTAFVERYPWVRWYTPVNEPFITAQHSAKMGWWNERRASAPAFVTAILNVSACAVIGGRIIAERRPDAIFLQSDACESLRPAEPVAAPLARHRDEVRLLGFDLVYGQEPSTEMRDWLLDNGATSAELDWFSANGSSAGAIVGLDYYSQNERLVCADGTEIPAERRGFGALARRYHKRYGLPVMLAETNMRTDQAVAWLEDTWNDTVALHESGVPVAGYCWYSLTDQVDWDTCLREANGTINSLGLVDLDRVRRPVAAVYERLARETVADGFPRAIVEGDAAAA
jgi:beta-glucosidase/6-phospho-beta-glucosidase/beta-galactosidase